MCLLKNMTFLKRPEELSKDLIKEIYYASYSTWLISFHRDRLFVLCSLSLNPSIKILDIYLMLPLNYSLESFHLTNMSWALVSWGCYQDQMRKKHINTMCILKGSHQLLLLPSFLLGAWAKVSRCSINKYTCSIFSYRLQMNYSSTYLLAQ